MKAAPWAARSASRRPRSVRLLDRELADRLEHHEPRLAVHTLDLPQEALLDQRGERIDDVAADILGTDSLDGLEPRSPCEDGEPRKQRAIGLVQHVVAPCDRRAQGLLPLGKVARATGEQPEPVGQAAEHRLGCEDADTCRRQLDRQRQPVESHADLGNRRGILVGDLERRLHRPRTLDEERDRLVL